MPSNVDIAIIGAGAAGLAAAARLRRENLSVLVLEARSRIGGRAFTLTPDETLPLDMGCGWLHSADQNLLTSRFEAMGLTIDRTPPPWSRPSINDKDASSALRLAAAFKAFDERLEAAAAEGLDRPAADLLIPDDPVNPRLNAVSAYYNGCAWDEVSLLDYAAYEDSQVNWRVREGYGAALALLASPVAIRLNAAVQEIDLTGKEPRVVTAKGTVSARSIILCVPSSIIAEERIKILPRPDRHIAAAEGLPLGNANKVFLSVSAPSAFEADTQVIARQDRAETGGYSLCPFGRPYVEAYFGGRHAAALEAAGRAAMIDFAVEELVLALGSDIRRTLSPLAASGWSLDPFARGAYSHAKPGLAGARAMLAEPISDRLFIAGEATHDRFFSTAHGAYETGTRAAEEALRALKG